MTNCKEFILDDVMAVTAIPLANIPAGSITSPVNQLTPTLPKSFIAPSMLAGSITIGLQPATPGGALIPIMRKSGKAKDDENDSVAGRLHTVTVTCEADDRNSDVWNDLLALERTPSHILLTFRDNTRAFVAATQDTYLCTVERDGSKTSVTLRIQNLMGIQLLV
jgi:hypothetical protein